MKNTPILIYTNEDSYGYTNKTFEYLLGFQPSLGYMIFDTEKLHIILDSRYFSKLDNIDTGDLFDKIEKEIELQFSLLDKPIEDLIKIDIENRQINIENSSSLSVYNKLVNFGFEVNIVNPVFEKNRITKDISEIKNIKKAIKIIEKTWKQIEKLNKSGELIGKTEIEIRQFIIQKIFEYGGTGESFKSIVAFGKNSAIPHHESGKTKIKNSGVLLIDMGCIYNGYCSDFTRTLWVGEKNEEYKKYNKIKNIVKKAHDKSSQAIVPGIKCNFLDKIARDYITESGYGEYFTHSTGHGVGLNIHEAPYISYKSNETIESGMTFTIEPGIYLTGEFGVRYENIFIV